MLYNIGRINFLVLLIWAGFFFANQPSLKSIYSSYQTSIHLIRIIFSFLLFFEIIVFNEYWCIVFDYHFYKRFMFLLICLVWTLTKFYSNNVIGSRCLTFKWLNKSIHFIVAHYRLIWTSFLLFLKIINLLATVVTLPTTFPALGPNQYSIR